MVSLGYFIIDILCRVARASLIQIQAGEESQELECLHRLSRDAHPRKEAARSSAMISLARVL